LAAVSVINVSASVVGGLDICAMVRKIRSHSTGQEGNPS
jgi:hypothetical protein